MIPEKHPSIAATLEHFKSDEMPASSNIPSGHSTTPTMQTIVVNCVSIVNPQLAPIIGDDLEVVAACLEDSHAPCPAYSEVIAPSKARPSASCVTIVHIVLPASHIRSATLEILASATLTKVESVLPEETMAIRDRIATFTACARNSPSVASIGTMVPEQHPSVAATLKHLKPDNMPPTTNIPFDLTIAPAMQPIVINCVPIVEPKLAPIIGDDTEMVMACPEESHAPCPTYSKVIASVETRPFAASVTIVHIVFPTSHVRFAAVQVLAPATLTKVESILHE
jgi:hypothetical protein